MIRFKCVSFLILVSGVLVSIAYALDQRHLSQVCVLFSRKIKSVAVDCYVRVCVCVSMTMEFQYMASKRGEYEKRRIIRKGATYVAQTIILKRCFE